MVAIAKPIPSATTRKPRPTADPTQDAPAGPTLAELAAAQQAHAIFACDLCESAEHLARLRATYAHKRNELSTVRDVFEVGTPDLILRATDGRQVVIRLPGGDAGEVFGVLHSSLSAGLRQLEQDIVSHLLLAEKEEADKLKNPARWANPVATFGAPILALCAPSDPAACQRGDVWAQRTEAAEAREEALQQQHGNEHAYGREILWHPSFPEEYLALIERMPLREISDFHAHLAGLFNQNRPLDAHDYAYLADVLREALADEPTPLAELRLRRALAWLEQVDTTPALPWPTPPTPAAPALALAA